MRMLQNLRLLAALFLIAAIAATGCADTDESAASKDEGIAPVADEVMDKTFDEYLFVDVEEFVDHGVVEQQFAVSETETIYCGPKGSANIFNSKTGCAPYSKGTTNVAPQSYYDMVATYVENLEKARQYFAMRQSSELETQQAALTLMEGVQGRDCYGPSGPRYSTWCGDVQWVNPETGELEDYAELWFVATFITNEGECLLVPIADPCTPDAHERNTRCVFNTAPTSPSNMAVCEAVLECTADTVAICDDGNACTVDTCDELGLCAHSALTCNDDNACTADTCDMVTGCVFDAQALQGDSCDDGDLCTIDDACNAGMCEAKDLDCNDDNTCTVDSCTNGVCINEAQVSMSCDDGDLCTVQDACNAAGACIGLPADDDDNNPCTLDMCDSTTGTITNTSLDTGAICVMPEGAGDGVCTAEGACTQDFCVFTDADILAGNILQGACPDIFDSELVTDISTWLTCSLVDGTHIGFWEMTQECGPSDFEGAVKCLPDLGCVACAPGFCLSETNCTDGIDNDGDTLADCDDPDCTNDPTCLPPTSWCADTTPVFEGNCDFDVLTDLDPAELQTALLAACGACYIDPTCDELACGVQFAQDLGLSSECTDCVDPILEDLASECLVTCITDMGACYECILPYWTVDIAMCTGAMECLPDAEPLCADDLDCDDGDDMTTDTCVAPGYCEHIPVTPLYGVNDLVWTLAGDVNEEIASIDSVNVHGCNVPYTVETSDSTLVIAFATDPAGCRVNVLLTHNTQGTVYSPSCWPEDWTNYSSIPSDSYPDSDDDGIADACGVRTFGSMARFCDAAGTDVPVVPNVGGDGVDFQIGACL